MRGIGGGAGILLAIAKAERDVTPDEVAYPFRFRV
jgi:hypothetical protein